MASKTFRVPNISCNHCKMTIERELKGLAGVKSVNVAVDPKTVSVDWDTPATEESIRKLLAEINYPVAG